MANLKIILIQFIEYLILFLIIGHPNYLLLGILNSLNTFIPFIGTIFTNIIAITTASVISKRLLILTSIISIIMPQIDAYFITPKIYKNTNKIPQTLYIATMIILGSIFKMYGVILSLPLLIIILEIIKYKNIVKNN
jgi:predicted PurR-regulated permease PerM